MPPANPKFQDLIIYVISIINNAIIPLVFAIALVLFIWGVVQYVINAQDTEKKAKGRQFMIWGIIALTVMLTVWGLVAVLGRTFGLETRFLPQVQPESSSSSPGETIMDTPDLYPG
ncbi:hypothetical protein A2933_01295 [Candidatus Nomurabacteria bacterium RIFCSPLOWO2_01_FULL_46_18]|uniref:Uncharacterized protein n=1 Tax=Candidatus Nomurabacteria bacterium RIFCSPLOWO2_01_FULL_46_18 TaxID=1801783 RepID=A0A1F6XDH7_9BACT|nr:MAG: hypothetical protein A2933_01295 [Candidatus Nomurabacteria bacterium RIFCSPLOWO2_01_FULL_46_18]